tara:strand:- start:228 stop:482 length:255 start_codon:yes stop_codon:yes gene_type:complete
MIKKFKLSVSLFLNIALICSTVFFGALPSLATQTSSNDINNSLGIVIEESTEKMENLKMINEPDLGDDQTFPFIPGFGKNSGKD